MRRKASRPMLEALEATLQGKDPRRAYARAWIDSLPYGPLIKAEMRKALLQEPAEHGPGKHE